MCTVDSARRAGRRGYQSGGAGAAGARLSHNRGADGRKRRSADGQYYDPGGAMTDKSKNWWSGLSIRERWLVGVAGALALGVLVWGFPRTAVPASIEL